MLINFPASEYGYYELTQTPPERLRQFVIVVKDQAAR